ncbi:MAG: sterol desaturase family protein [Alphaproteobacteria bacterium]|nr:sterol desaturase family protein [Alphaproteobacteria bacterium]MCB9791984.1 sterol desaturase family protein [Alphaproteobacteria bacterium]
MRLLASALLNLAWAAAIFLPLEATRPARSQPLRRPGLLTDLAFYAGQVFLFLPGCAWVLYWTLGPLAEASALAPLRAAYAALPTLLQLALAVSLADLLAYWGHRAQHRVPLLWRFHAVHHSAEHVDWLAAYREHPLDGLYTQALVNLPALLLGLDLRAWMGLVVFRGLWAVLVHSNTRLPLGPLRWLLGAPEFHRAHHARTRDPGHYANLAPYWDWLLGTHGAPGEPAEMGLEEPHPRSWPGLILWPLRRPVSEAEFSVRPTAPRSSLTPP